ncbi:helix-turn-helix domain-containing protein [Streptomyces sp. G-G2]|uniref:ArsR/SmtB family transcription factor n=1 Tax=Streptomyces sp. G-G2 TaxID=3046201 RepID=UPI0024BB3EBE|nr:helix-turn-helix domain-containing protein [Streptomyces sp. G-G2]MDJ0380704.1 helix-turn-helix domain-containing protein [Streptomyces sp. G-G2]
MLRVQFTAEDLLGVRFAPEPLPLIELALALVAAQRTDEAAVFGSWRLRLARELPRAALPLLELLRPDGDNPSFVEPALRDFEEALVAVRDGLPRVGPQELTRILARSPGGASSAGWLRGLHDRDRESWDVLEAALRCAHRAVIAPHWAAIGQSFRADVAWRTRLLATHGIKAALASTHPAATWTGTAFEVGLPPDFEIRLAGRGLTLMPSPFWTGRPLLAEHPDGSHMLVYPAMTPLPLVAGGRAEGSLDALLGRTRAAVLQSLTRQRTTSELARDLDISLPSVSEHTRTLRAAGLITTRRDGKAVLHAATGLGVELLLSGG